jgi:thiamine pyrophosphate-dependent acetolactate synthase large subunit-like protein
MTVLQAMPQICAAGKIVHLEIDPAEIDKIKRNSRSMVGDERIAGVINAFGRSEDLSAWKQQFRNRRPRRTQR